MKKFRFSSLRDFEAKAFSSLSIRFIKMLEGWPVSIAHENIPENEKNLPFVVHEKTSEFIYVISGGGKAGVGNKYFNVAAGDCLLIQPGVKHRFVTGKKTIIALSVFSPPMTFDDLDAISYPVSQKRRKRCA